MNSKTRKMTGEIQYFEIFLYFFLSATVLTSSNTSSVIAPPPKSVQNLPQVYLKRYIEEDGYGEQTASSEFQTNDVVQHPFIVKNGTTYIISPQIREAHFACVADYPVMWKIPFPEEFSGMTTYTMQISSERLSTFEDGFTEPRNTGFETDLRLRVMLERFHASQSGHLTCHSVKNPGRNVTIYVYTEGETEIEDSATISTVNVTTLRSQVVLPCRPTHPNVSLVLEKEITSRNGTTTWVQVSLVPPWLTFDPKKGFIFSRMRSAGDLGTYRCTVDEEDGIHKLIQVKRGMRTTSPNKFERKMELKSKSAKIYPNHSSRYHEFSVECCTGNETEFFMETLSFRCGNDAECELLKPVVMHDIKEERLSFSEVGLDENHCASIYMDTYYSMFLFCRATDLEVAAHYVPIFNRSGAGRDMRDAVEAGEDIKIDQKINITIRPVTYFYETYFRPGEPPIRTRSFYEHSSTTLYEGASAAIRCSGIPYYYADNGWLRLTWKNGSRTVFRKMDTENTYRFIASDFSMEKQNNCHYDYGCFDLFLVGHIDKLSKEMVKVECFFPRWNDEGWDQKSFQLEISESEPPILEGPQVEYLAVKMNATDIKLNCSVAPRSDQDSEVVTTITWRKDYKPLHASPDELDPILSSMQTLEGNVSNSSVTLSRVTPLTQGVYQCIAENAKGTAAKTFHVTIEKEDDVTFQMVAITVACSVAASVAIAIILFMRGRCHLQIKIGWGKKS